MSDHPETDAELGISPGTGTAARLWCDKRATEIVMDPVIAKIAAEKLDELFNHLDFAWTVIANATDWDRDSRVEWRKAAERWRDEWKEILKP